MHEGSGVGVIDMSYSLDDGRIEVRFAFQPYDEHRAVEEECARLTDFMLQWTAGLPNFDFVGILQTPATELRTMTFTYRLPNDFDAGQTRSAVWVPLIQGVREHVFSGSGTRYVVHDNSS